MARRVGTVVVGNAVLLSVCAAMASSVAGCYSHHTADEELLDIPFPDSAYDDDDAGVVPDAAGPRCAQTDPIAAFICNLTTPAATTTTPGATPDIADLLNAAGGLSGLAGLFGGTATGTNGAANPFGDLLAGLGLPTTGTGAMTGTGTPSLADLLGGLGIPPTGTTPDAGTGRPPRAVTMPSAQDCVSPTSPITQFICSLQPGAGATTTPVDAGAPVIGI